MSAACGKLVVCLQRSIREAVAPDPGRRLVVEWPTVWGAAVPGPSCPKRPELEEEGADFEEQGIKVVRRVLMAGRGAEFCDSHG